MRADLLDHATAVREARSLSELDASCFPAAEAWSEGAYLQDRPRKWELSFIVRSGAAIVGCAIGSEPIPGCAHLHRLAVSPCEQGRGMGALLVRRWIEAALSAGLSRLTVEAYRPDLAAFYEPLGFRRLGGEALLAYLSERGKSDQADRYLTGSALVFELESPR